MRVRGFAFDGVRSAAGLLLVALALLPGVALAQQDGIAAFLDSSIEVKGKGWEQLGNHAEMIDFLLGLAEATVLTALITYHPTSLACRRTEADFQMPRTLFIYGLIGMTIGFLVLHHGYVIGFLVFGIGGLLRFRTDVGSTEDTTRLILVVLIGLCIGLNLPVMALITTASAWIVIYVLGASNHFTLEVKFDEKRAAIEKIDNLQRLLGERGFRTVTVSKSKFKPTAEFVLAGRSGVRREALIREMTALQSEKQNLIADWHLD